MSLFDDFLREFRRLTNQCASASLLTEASRELQNSLRVMDTTRHALNLSSSPRARQMNLRLQRAATPLRQVSDTLSRVQGLCEDGEALARIVAASRALSQMNRHGGTVRDHPEEAGRCLANCLSVPERWQIICRHLPTPMRKYCLRPVTSLPICKG